MTPITLALVGIGGYGNGYVDALLDAPNQDEFRLVGAIDPWPAACMRLDDLQALRVPIYPSLAGFYEEQRAGADLVIVCTPLHLHAEHTCLALKHGSHVLCEKPLCVTPTQINQMIEARDRAQRHVAIGYQWSFSRAVQQLKGDILAGLLGKPRRLRSLVLWPRDEAYYSRARWAGAKRDSNGNWVLDSPVNNACAHYLHNMFYLQGTQVDRSAQPAKVTAELNRAHVIENYDTAVLRCRMRSGVEVFFAVSHATASTRGPVFQYEFEKATVSWTNEAGAAIVAKFADGSVKNYGSPSEPRDRKLWLTINAIGAGKASVCGIEAAAAHVQCTWAAQQSVSQIHGFPDSSIKISGERGSRKTWVEGLDDQLEQCFENWKLPTELGLPWASPGREVNVDV